MFRLGSLLMIVLLAAPIVRDCCLPVTQTPPCHESKPAHELTCAPNQQAIPEMKAAIGVAALARCSDLLAIYHAQFAPSMMDLRTSEYRNVVPTRAGDLYLRNAALLI